MEFEVKGIEMFHGFLCGLIAEDYDIEKVYIDAVYKIVDIDLSLLPKYIQRLENLANKFKIDFILSLNIERKDIPENIKKVFVTSHDIMPEWHIKMQAAFQKYTDNAVSKTINFNKEATKEDIHIAYGMAYELGCKGVTVYRDGSRENQVLNIGSEVKEPPTNGHRIAPRERPDITTGITQKIETGCGHLYVTINSDEKGACELFTQMGKVGGCASAQLEAIARLTSLCLRSNVKVSSIVKQLQGIRCPSPMWNNGQMVTSCADGVSKSLERFLQLDNDAIADIKELNQKTVKAASVASRGLMATCPDCGSSVEHSEGCLKCNSCGWSKC